MSKIKLLNNQGDEVTIEHSDTLSKQGNLVVNIKDIIKQVDTIANLKALDGSHKLVYVTGYHTAGDGAFGSHFFEWDATSTEADNGGTIIKLDSIDTGRYKLKYNGDVNTRWFGGEELVSKSINYIFKNANYTASANDFIYCDTSVASFTITLPANPSANARIGILDNTSNFDKNPLTIARNGNTIMGVNEDMIVSTKNISLELIFNGNDWRIK